MRSWRRDALVLLILIVAWPAVARAAEDDAVRNALLDSGPYPRLYLLPLPATLPGAASAGAKDWRLRVVQALAGKGYATVTTGGDAVSWKPAPGNESRIRTNMDANYELIDYSLLLGTVDLTIASVQVNGDRAEAVVSEQLTPAGLYELVGPLVPAEVQAERVRPGSRTLQLAKQGTGWRITTDPATK